MNSLLQEVMKKSPQINLFNFLKTFTGPVHVGKDKKDEKLTMELARQDIQAGKNCVVVFDTWWTVLTNGRQWMDCLKLIDSERR